LCGDINIAHADIDVHPRERKPGVIGQRAEERALFEKLLGAQMVDVGRALNPDSASMFSWWPPWRNMRSRNIGWRIDYILASKAVAGRAASCAVLADVGTSDHAPVVMTTAECPVKDAASGPRALLSGPRSARVSPPSPLRSRR